MKTKSFVLWISVAAVFLFAYWPDTSGKITDLLLLVIGAALITTKETRFGIKALWPKLKPYAWSLFAIFALTAIAQVISYIHGQNSIDKETAVNYGRLAFNAYTFFVAAFLVYFYGKKYLLPASLAILLSPLLAIPAYWNPNEGVYVGGGRLMGFMQSPILCGLWTVVAFIIGIVIFVNYKKAWQRILMAVVLVVLASFIEWSASRASWLGLLAAIVALIVYYACKEKIIMKAGLVAIAFIFSLIMGYRIALIIQPKIHILALNRATNFATSIIKFSPSEIESQNQSEAWPKTFEFLLQNPLGLGFGYYGIATLTTKYNYSYPFFASNSLMELISYGGFGSLIALLILVFNLGKEAWKKIMSFSREDALRHLKLGWIVATAAFAVGILFTNAFLWRHTWFLLGTVLGICLDKTEQE
ncbi:MAG: hypothetical protein KGJ89_03835 [Patescibacteria group bacterium]|nr:hypothetical protein [Patescibacteria group bacterium]MDE2015255.1 hypothetical protein [Patescibacteria group bacterium]MDE2227061.1 hypothetical protein [Patescibacteria group bacterium]